MEDLNKSASSTRKSTTYQRFNTSEGTKKPECSKIELKKRYKRKLRSFQIE